MEISADLRRLTVFVTMRYSNGLVYLLYGAILYRFYIDRVWRLATEDLVLSQEDN